VENSVCAVIVTFCPGQQVLSNLRKVLPQVQDLVLVDNGSSMELLEPFHGAKTELGFTMLENGENLGIATALNLGVEWAKAQKYRWVILFDQDSTVTDGFVEAMLREYENYGGDQPVAIVTPRRMERDSGVWKYPPFARDGSPEVAITSGSLMPMDIFDRCGLFEDDLFIDSVDEEYCLRARSLGYTLAFCRRAVLLHSLGSSKVHSVLRHRFEATHHSAGRRYYMSRNRVIILRRYWGKHRKWCFETVKIFVRHTIHILLVEDNRFGKIRNIFRGVFDGLSGRTGHVVKL
jgi:rhamnosyltransferase